MRGAGIKDALRRGMRLQDTRCSLVLTHKLQEQLKELKALGASPCCDCVRCQKAVRDCNCVVCAKPATATTAALPVE